MTKNINGRMMFSCSKENYIRSTARELRDEVEDIDDQLKKMSRIESVEEARVMYEELKAKMREMNNTFIYLEGVVYENETTDLE